MTSNARSRSSSSGSNVSCQQLSQANTQFAVVNGPCDLSQAEFIVKAEQHDDMALSPSSSSSLIAGASDIAIKKVELAPTQNLARSSSEPISLTGDTALEDDPFSGLFEETKFEVYPVYKSSDDINYNHDEAIAASKKMATALKALLERMELGSQRREIWAGILDSILKFILPTKYVAVTGGTGAGKSSLINAILDVNLLPTSGMQATKVILFIPLRYITVFMSCLDILGILGSVTTISEATPEAFVRKIGRFVDSKRQRRGGARMPPPQQTVLTDFYSRESEHDDNENDVPLWPLVSKVQIFCKSATLSSGVILVDLPGIADSNAARSSIAKHYMKNAHFIFIVAPIQRAVDEKAARDLLGMAFRTQAMMGEYGQYDASNITFIPTKCEDLSIPEIISTLELHQHPSLVDIEGRMKSCSEVIKGLVAESEQSKQIARAIEKSIAEDEKACDILNALISPPRDVQATKTPTTKRKPGGIPAASTNSPKRRRLEGQTALADDSTRPSVEEHDVEENTEQEGRKSAGNEPQDDSSNVGSQNEGLRSALQSSIGAAKSSLIAKQQDLLREQGRLQLLTMSIIEKQEQENALQKEKAVFCSLERSKWSCNRLKDDFRIGLKEMDDMAAESNNPDEYDPDVDLRDYAEVDLPVFPCSAREYSLLKGQTINGGKTTCFSKIEDTNIPALQRHCLSLPIPSRNLAVENLLIGLKTFAEGVHTALTEGDDGGLAADRAKLRGLWESSHRKDSEKGVQDRLDEELRRVAVDQMRDLRAALRNGLEEKCRLAAAMAANAAVEATDTFLLGRKHANTLKATLKRDGCWKGDMNIELCEPYTRKIASSWQQVFERDQFSGLEDIVLRCVKKLVDDVEESAGQDFKARVKRQGESCMAEINLGLRDIVEIVNATLTTEQKEASRSLSPHIQSQLLEGYRIAREDHGKGVVARQKATLHHHVDTIKDVAYNDATDIILRRLDYAVERIENNLKSSFKTLAKKVGAELHYSP
ncbi:hypothetical protein HWV62_8413 [Athelia sp. TMB]|nr:hypothetical protein HWV62_8413 [Athelia sp. TMB]